MFGKYLAASVALVLGTTAAMTAQANYYAQPVVAQPMMAQPMMAAPAPVVSPTIIVNNANTQQQSNQGNQVAVINGPLSIDLALQRCALGGMLMGRTNPTLASSTNVTSVYSSFTATTSGMSSPTMCVTPLYVAAAFIRDSMSELEADLTLGRGEHLTALNSIIGCNTASKNLRSEYAAYTKTAKYSVSTNINKADQLFQIVDRNLSSSACSA